MASATSFQKRVSAFGVNGGVANDCKFVRVWRHEEEHPVSLARLFHSKPDKMFLSSCEGILDILAADEHADFAGGFQFRCANRRSDFVVMQPV